MYKVNSFTNNTWGTDEVSVAVTLHGIKEGSNVDLPYNYTPQKLPPILDYCLIWKPD